MKKLYFLSTLMLLMTVMLPQNVKAQVSVWDGTYAPWTNGNGTEADPFLIENAQQLAYLTYRVNNGLDAAGGHVSNHDLYYKLMTDVNLNGSENFQWTPIGYWISENNYYSFGGHFDGNNHTVSGLYINSSADRVGFFGYVDGATIINLSVEGDTIATTGQYVGGVVGCAYGKSKIINCSNKCNIGITSVGGFSGGIVASASEIIINKCYNTGIINHRNIDGFNYENTIKGMSGGIIGIVDSNLDVKNCYNTGYMKGTVYVLVQRGGIVGCCDSNATIIITSCFNIGDVELFDSHYGGNAIVGNAVSSNAITNCFYLMHNNLLGYSGGIPLTEEEMHNPGFVNILNNSSCAWEQDVAPYVNDGYPILTMIIEDAYTEPTTDLTANSANLHGSIAVEHANITSKGFEYRVLGDTTFNIVNVFGNVNSFSYLLNGLTPNTIYEYRTFVNVAECPYTSYGNIQTFEVSWLNADTILIYDADMLQWVSDRCNTGTTFEGKYIKLMNNIVLPLNQPNNMTSIGVYPSYPFKGTFDGNGMLISNLYIDHPNTEYQGFFGYTLNANLYEVGLVNITASGRNYTGGMVAYAANTYMRDCYVNGGSLFALSYCGGLVGYQSEGTNSIISGCYNTCTVSGTSYVGGLVGFSNYATVRNSYVAASVAAQGSAVGAIIGGANEVLMYNCYFSTSITGQSDAIGEHNFRDGEGLSNVEMQSTQFVATLNQGLVRPVWKSDYATPINNGFPILIWQYSDVETCDAPTNPNAVVNGTSATLSWSGGDNASYYVVEYGVLGGETHSENTSSHQLTLHNLQSTNYFWRVKSVCSFGESNFVNGNNITVGIDDYNSFNFKVYPNPTNGIVNVQFTDHNSPITQIHVYDIYGKLLGVNVVEANDYSPRQTAQIDLSRYANGVYFIKAVANGHVVGIRKVVKQ